MFLPGESQGRGSLVGCRLWGRRVEHEWSDLAAAAALDIWYMSMFVNTTYTHTHTHTHTPLTKSPKGCPQRFKCGITDSTKPQKMIQGHLRDASGSPRLRTAILLEGSGKTQWGFEGWELLTWRSKPASCCLPPGRTHGAVSSEWPDTALCVWIEPVQPSNRASGKKGKNKSATGKASVSFCQFQRPQPFHYWSPREHVTQWADN